MRSWNDFLIKRLPPASLMICARLLGVGVLWAGGGSLHAQQPVDVAPPTADQASLSNGPANAHELLAAFAKLDGLEASFVETKHLALLAVPLKSEGQFYFCAPGYLLRTISSPEPSTLLIEPGQLRMTNRDGSETIDLRQSDALRLFVTSLVRVFSGDELALSEHYTMAFDKTAESATWTLTLIPKGKPLTHMIRELSLSGEGFAVQTIVVKEPNGDRSVTTLSKVNEARVFTTEERLELFGLAPG
ncbi:MAG: hypothetical protein ACI9EF_003978 [Pseudohongiellaceae bacterium]|jgi:hypothetical protein